MGADGETQLSILAHGKTMKWGTIAKGFTDEFNPAADGSTIFVMGDGSGPALDFSKASGADAMLVQCGAAAKGGYVSGGWNVIPIFVSNQRTAAHAPRGGQFRRYWLSESILREWQDRS